MRRDRAELHSLAGAYALDAVAEADHSRFERHLAGCDQCRQEVRGFREAAARVGASAAVRPRAELRDRALLAAARTRQLPPRTGEEQPAGWARHATPGRRAARRGRSWLARGLTGLAAAVLAAAVAMGVLVVSTQHRLTQEQTSRHEMAAVLGAPDVTMLTAKVTTGGKAHVLVSRNMRAIVFTAAGLPALPASQDYELWLIGPHRARPAGMLPRPKAGMVGPLVVSGLAQGDRLGVTVEPAAGSARPTSPTIMLISLRP
ncbi:MAG: anti-sigma factor [Actinomycetota bacterium]